MKTLNILKTATTVLFASYIAAYLLNAILDFTMFQTWVTVLIAATVGVLGEIYWNQSPTLLKQRIKELEKNLENTKNNELLAINEIGSRWEVESELENAKAALGQQQAELDRVEIAYSKVEAKLEKSEAEKSEKDLRISELEAETKRWAATASQSQIDNQRLLKVINENDSNYRAIQASTQANLAEAEQTLSEIKKAFSGFANHFGHGIFSPEWDQFKKWWNVNLAKHNTNRLNAMTSAESRSDIMLPKEVIAIFEKHFFDESEVVSE